jgi:protein TonB
VPDDAEFAADDAELAREKAARARTSIERPGGRDLHVIPALATSPPGLSERLRLKPRQGLFLVVLALHVGVLALLSLAGTRDHLTILQPPIEAQLITDAPSQRETPPPLPPVVLERPQIDLIVPDVAITVAAPDAPIAEPAKPHAPMAAPAQAAPAPSQPVTPPRFDAAYLKNPPPTYPVASRRTREQGTVLMRVRVLREGTPAEVLLEHTSGSPHLDEAAMDAVRHWRFVPAHRGTESVEAWVLVPVEFELHR